MEIKTLGELCDIVSGGTPSRSKAEFWNEGTIPWIKIGNIKGKYVNEADEFITQKGLAGSSAKMLAKGTVLYTIFATLGEVGILDIDACTNQAIAGLTIKDTNQLSIDYLYYYLRSKKAYVNNIGRGVAQNNINMSILKSFEVPLPELSRQTEIVEITSKVSRIIETRQQELECLDNLIKARFVELFGDVKYGVDRWGEKNFKNITINLDSGRKPVKDEDRKKMQGIYPYYGATGIVDYVNDYRQEGEFLLISEDGKALELRSKPIAFLASGKIWVNNHAHVQQCTDECNIIYLMYHINLMDISAWVTGIDQKKLNRANLDTIPIALPPIELQNQFATFVKQVDKSKFVEITALP